MRKHHDQTHTHWPHKDAQSAIGEHEENEQIDPQRYHSPAHHDIHLPVKFLSAPKYERPTSDVPSQLVHAEYNASKNGVVVVGGSPGPAACPKRDIEGKGAFIDDVGGGALQN